MLASLFATHGAVAQEAPAPDLTRTVEELQKRVEAQGRELSELRAALKDETRAREATRTPGVFRVGGLKVRMFGYVQADVVAYDQGSVDQLNPSTGEPLNQTRFVLRRARLRADADYGFVGGFLELDGNTVRGPTARILTAEAWLQLPSADPSAPPLIMLTLGLSRIPFGFEVQEKDYVRLFMERSNVIRAMFPGEFDLGARLVGGWHFVRYQVAAMNGQPAADRQFTLQDPNKSKDFIGRLGVDTLLWRIGVQGGISALWGQGFRPGTPATKNTVQWVDANLDGQIDPTELLGVPGLPVVPSQSFDRFALGGDLRLTIDLPKLGGLAVYGEIVWGSNLDRGLIPADPITAGRDLREFGWYIAVIQQLTKWAAVGVRYDRYDPDSDRTEPVAGIPVVRDLSFTTLSVVAAGFYPPYGRLSIEWDHNTNGLGRSPSGAPITLGSDVVTLRGQVLF